MKRAPWYLAGVAVLASLAACSGKPQPAAEKAQAGVPAYAGTANPVYADPGWKAGDKASWEERMANRTRAGQNEYTRTSGP
jgi:hypothetical protein